MAEVTKGGKWNPPKSKKARQKMPSSYFLLPKERKFPYKTKTGKISCKGLRQAMVRAQQHGYRNVYQKAKRLYKKYCKSGGK